MTEERLPNLSRKVEPWPKSWDIHVLNACDLYFDSNKAVEFKDGGSFYDYLILPGVDEKEIEHITKTKSIELRLLFKAGGHNYGSALKHVDKNIIKGAVYYIAKLFMTVNDLTKEALDLAEMADSKMNIEVDPSSKMVLFVQTIGKFSCNSSYQGIKYIEKIISKDYPNRGDQDGGDSDKPDVPDPPLDSFQPEPDILLTG